MLRQEYFPLPHLLALDSDSLFLQKKHLLYDFSIERVVSFSYSSANI